MDKATLNTLLEPFRALLPEDVNALAANGRYPLLSTRSPGLILALFERGVDPNVRDKQGRALLHHIVQGDNDTLHKEYRRLSPRGLVRDLLRAGADPNARDNQGRTPLHYVCDSKYIRWLLAAGADIDVKDNNGLPVSKWQDETSGLVWERGGKVAETFKQAWAVAREKKALARAERASPLGPAAEGQPQGRSARHRPRS